MSAADAMAGHFDEDVARHDLRAVPQAIYRKYSAHFGDNTQGCCLLIADEIQRAIGGEVTAGYLTWYGGSCRRTHWWVTLDDGTVVDPMGDNLLSFEEFPGRVESHRDRATFEAILPDYEQWRVA